MGFNEAKRKAIECLLSGKIRHDTERTNINQKNLLLTGVVTPDEVVAVLRKTRGREHTSSPHYSDASTEVHIVTINRTGKETWYIKWYFIEPNIVFISVHH